MSVPSNPKIYHIVHIRNLNSIINDGFLWCDSEMKTKVNQTITIGMDNIKKRRLKELTLNSFPSIYVGDCVPFYFCPRSVMLYIIYQSNHNEITYNGGQAPILHLEADLYKAVEWANQEKRRWAFTLSNAGAYYFEDRCDLNNLNEINWEAVSAVRWSGEGIHHSIKEGKQAEFLMEKSFPWALIERIGVYSQKYYQAVKSLIPEESYCPRVEILPTWYY